jgi:hypothetical protein
MLMHLLRANRLGPGIPYHLAFLQEGPLAAEAAELGYPVRVLRTGHLRDLHRSASTVLELRRWIEGKGIEAVMSFPLATGWIDWQPGFQRGRSSAARK